MRKCVEKTVNLCEEEDNPLARLVLAGLLAENLSNTLNSRIDGLLEPFESLLSGNVDSVIPMHIAKNKCAGHLQAVVTRLEGLDVVLANYYGLKPLSAHINKLNYRLSLSHSID